MHTSIKIDEDIPKRVDFITDGTETVNQFTKKALLERLKRMEARDERATLQLAEKTKKIVTPIVEKILSEMRKRGEL